MSHPVKKPTIFPSSEGSLYDRLLPYQQNIVQWCVMRELKAIHGVRGGILNLEMGLGKTVISTAMSDVKGNYPEVDAEKARDRGTTLIITPKSLVTNFVDHIERWSPGSKYFIMHKSYDKRSTTITARELLTYDYVITTYDTCKSAYDKDTINENLIIGTEGIHRGKVIQVDVRKHFKENLSEYGYKALYYVNFTRVIADEAHVFCNPGTVAFKAMMAIPAKYRWCLTGTPFRNKDQDVWALLRFCGMTIFNNAKEWRAAEFVRSGMDKVLMRVNYDQADVQLPHKEDHVIEYDFSEPESKAYKTVLESLTVVLDGQAVGIYSFAEVLAMLTRLRQVCIAPFLITAESKLRYRGFLPDAEAKEIANIDHDKLNEATDGFHGWIRNYKTNAGMYSAKIEEVMKVLTSIPKGEKAVCFSSFSISLQLIVDRLERELRKLPDKDKYSYIIVDGQTKDRDAIINAFRDDPDLKIMFTTYKVGGDGLNLTAANHALLIEPWWCPAVHRQAERRIYRPGQTKPCHVYTFTAKRSIESELIKMHIDRKNEREKALLDCEDMGQDGFDEVKGVNREMILKLLKRRR